MSIIIAMFLVAWLVIWIIGEVVKGRQIDSLENGICPICKSEIKGHTEYIPAHKYWESLEGLYRWEEENYRTYYKCNKCGYKKISY